MIIPNKKAPLDNGLTLAELNDDGQNGANVKALKVKSQETIPTEVVFIDDGQNAKIQLPKVSGPRLKRSSMVGKLKGKFEQIRM